MNESKETKLERDIFVKPLLNPKGYKGVVQEIPSCPNCRIKLDSRQPEQKFEFRKKVVNGRKFDLVVPECPRCGDKVEPEYHIAD